MKLGLDFDNTIVRYDELFAQVAREKGWFPADAPATKHAVREHLRAGGEDGENRWIELQGLVYGSRIADAPPTEGVLDFVSRCGESGATVCVISHKTLFPHKGPRVSLHEAARAWLEKHRLRWPAFFELTKQAKLQRIARCGCDVFIDDLPEFLAEPTFPVGVLRVLYDPLGQHRPDPRTIHARSWDDIGRLLFDAGARRVAG